MSSRWHLALESSSFGGSVALFLSTDQSHETLVQQEVLSPGGGSVRHLAPTIQRVLRQAQIKPADLQLISVTHGPGSFTGLRVGLATAKMLSWAYKIPIAPVDTLAATALHFAREFDHHNANRSAPVRLVAAINAFRKQVFTSSWEIDPNSPSKLHCVSWSAVCDASKWLENPWPSAASLEPAASPLWITGTALDVYSSFASSLVQLAPPELRQPMAEDVGYLGSQIFQAGQAVTAQQLTPNYIRSSAAEEKR